ncbi:uncharacterized protein [Littorina saxatilis]
MERPPTTGSILSLGHFPLTDCQSSVWINQQPPEKPEVMCIIHTAPVFQFQQFTFKHGYMYWRGIRMTWHGALHYRLPLKRSEVPRYDVQAACRVVPGFAEDDDQIQSILC